MGDTLHGLADGLRFSQLHAKLQKASPNCEILR